MTFQFYGTDQPYPFLLYDVENLSFGGYSFHCGDQPRSCGEPFYIDTNDTTGRTWTLEWEIVFNYPAAEPLL